MNITYKELFTGWMNYEKENMTRNKFTEINVYNIKQKKSSDYIPDFRDALFIFWDWQSRKIPIQSYIVHESREINKTLMGLDGEQKDTYEEIKNKFIDGDILHPYQRHLDDQFYQTDDLYNHSDIHHLHLNKLVNNQKNVTPCKHIIFIRISGNNAYFIDITAHKDFHDERLLKIIDDNWPNKLLLAMNMPGLNASTIKPHTMKALRKNNLIIFSNINDKIILPSYGVNCAGGRNASTQQYNRWVYILKRLQCIINNSLDNVQIPNKVLYTIPIGYSSGCVQFDSCLDKSGFMLYINHKKRMMTI